jgi:hypothetical protein
VSEVPVPDDPWEFAGRLAIKGRRERAASYRLVPDRRRSRWRAGLRSGRA